MIDLWGVPYIYIYNRVGKSIIKPTDLMDVLGMVGIVVKNDDFIQLPGPVDLGPGGAMGTPPMPMGGTWEDRLAHLFQLAHDTEKHENRWNSILKKIISDPVIYQFWRDSIQFRSIWSFVGQNMAAQRPTVTSPNTKQTMSWRGQPDQPSKGGVLEFPFPPKIHQILVIKAPVYRMDTVADIAKGRTHAAGRGHLSHTKAAHSTASHVARAWTCRAWHNAIIGVNW